MTELLIHRNLSGDSALPAAWEELRKREPRFFPGFAEAKTFLEDTGSDYRVLIAKERSEIIAIACFLNRKSKKYYTLGERRLFGLPIRETDLFGASVLGQADVATLTTLLQRAIAEWEFDLLKLGEVVVGSNLHNAILNLKNGIVITRAERKDSIRHLIKLPPSFEGFVKALSGVTRSSVTRKLKKFERDFQFEFEVVSRPEQVDKFLVEGEKISRLTYQWHVGQRLTNDEPTRRRFVRLAEAGQLRCYMLYIDGRPVAFLRGELSDNLYHYETPGYDPEFQKASPGIVILMWVIRDLIENTNCKLFDFGTGGDDSGYKSHYSNVYINCTPLELGRLYRPYSMLLVLLQEGLSLAKNIASAGIGSGSLRQRLRRIVRR